MFWGVTIENDKRYTQTVEASFHLSMAALHPTPPAGLDLTKSSTVSLWVQHDKAEFLLCTLEYGVLYQQPLDCNFTEGEELTFFLNGQGVIHLTGYLIEDMSMADSIEEPISESEEDSEESEDIPALVDAKELAKGAKKRTKEMKQGPKKKFKVEEAKESEDSSDEESDSDDDDFEDEESSSEDIPEEDSDESEDEEITRKKSKKETSVVAKNNTSHSIKQPEQTKSVIKEQKLSENLKKKAKKILSNSNQSADIEDSLDKILLDAAISSEKKKKKKKKKKQTKSLEMSNDPVPNKKQESSSRIEESKKSLSRVLSSGLAIEDTQVGQGSEARIGRQVHVYYSGKLAKTGKMFDRCINGKPFRFTLGKGEVISGWEKGLVGMRVGGKRTLTVPAKLGYGNQKMGPIPPNSSLIFDIELKAIS